jgi:hypothetical protein
MEEALAILMVLDEAEATLFVYAAYDARHFSSRRDFSLYSPWREGSVARAASLVCLV